ncbi:MAG: alpha/beta fold hydrolase [Candidatus Aureabacteria bacterium]|nr:alpha/beta fold hydrolase [Candidatus Auribacterota bacterium]
MNIFSNYRHELREITSEDGIPIKIRSFKKASNKYALIYIHGIQSHSEWSLETGSWFSENGFNFYAYDRRGSGLSGGKRGDCGSEEVLLRDFDKVIEFVRGDAMPGALFIMGLCWGAKTALCRAIKNPSYCSGIILLSPGIKTVISLPLRRKIFLAGDMLFGGKHYIKIPLKDEMFTDNPKYIGYINKDTLSLRKATSRFFYVSRKMESDCIKNIGRITTPILCFLSGKDPIVDNDYTKKLLSGPNRRVIDFPDSLHSIEFDAGSRLEMLELAEEWAGSICR